MEVQLVALQHSHHFATMPAYLTLLALLIPIANSQDAPSMEMLCDALFVSLFC